MLPEGDREAKCRSLGELMCRRKSRRSRGEKFSQSVEAWKARVAVAPSSSAPKQANKPFAAGHASTSLHLCLHGQLTCNKGATSYLSRNISRWTSSRGPLDCANLSGQYKIASTRLLQVFNKCGSPCTKQHLPCYGGDESSTEPRLFLWYSAVICLL